MPLPHSLAAEKRGPFWYLGFARMPQAERISTIRQTYFGKSPAEINEAAFAMVENAVAAGNWQALADTLPEMRRLMSATV